MPIYRCEFLFCLVVDVVVTALNKDKSKKNKKWRVSADSLNTFMYPQKNDK